jgi:hypothetical protein
MLWSSARVGRASPGGPVNSLTADELARGDNTPVVALTMREGRWYVRYQEEETFDAGAMAVRRRRGGVRRRRLSVVPSRLPARPYPRALGGRATATRSPRQARLTGTARPGLVAPCGEPVDGPTRSTLRSIRNGSYLKLVDFLQIPGSPGQRVGRQALLPSGRDLIDSCTASDDFGTGVRVLEQRVLAGPAA